MRHGLTNRALLGALLLGLVPCPASGDIPPCSAKPEDEAIDGCVEECALPSEPDEKVSEWFLERLKTIRASKHHIDTAIGDTLVRRLSGFRVAPFGLPPEHRQRWQQNRRYAGPCSGLIAVFYSDAIDDRDTNNRIDLYELRYRTEGEARRVAGLLGSAWDWNYHPFFVVHSGRSAIVAEGRHRAWGQLASVAKHFGTRWPTSRARPSPALCDREQNVGPVFASHAGEPDGELAVYVLGFSPSGRVAWLESRPRASGTSWSLSVVDLVNDRRLASETYQAKRAGIDGLCSAHGAALATLLAEQGITEASFATFDQPKPGTDPSGLDVRSASPARTEVVLRGQHGTKVLGTIASPPEATRTLGFLRSPFEARVAALVLAKSVKGAGVALHVFGGRLDKGWKP